MTDRAPDPSPSLLHPGVHAAARPDHPAVVVGGDGTTITYAELEARSNCLARRERRAAPRGIERPLTGAPFGTDAALVRVDDDGDLYLTDRGSHMITTSARVPSSSSTASPACRAASCSSGCCATATRARRQAPRASRGRPRPRSAMRLRMISLEPPAIVQARA